MNLARKYPYVDAYWHPKYKAAMQMRNMNFLVCKIGQQSTPNTASQIIIPMTQTGDPTDGVLSGNNNFYTADITNT